MEATCNTLKISVVMATYNRANFLHKTISHLVNQELDAALYEVIIVDDGSTDNTRQVVEQERQVVPFHIKYLHHPNAGPGYAQNRGIREARANIVLLMADDIFMAPAALREHIDFHRNNPDQKVAVLGNVVQSPDLNQSVFLKKWDPFRFDELEELSELRPYRFGACNLSFKKDFMMRFGMFLEHKGRNGAASLEDFELGYRLEKHGMRLLYAINALGYHHHVTTLDSAINRWREKGLNYGEFRKYATHPELTVYFHILTFKTFREYFRVLRGPNSFSGKEKCFIYHVVRELVRRITLNRFTSAFLWKPVLDMAEKKTWIASLITSKIYRAYLYYSFLRGVSDAKKLYGD